MLRRSAQHCSPDCPGSLDLHRSAVNIPGTCRHNKEAVVKGTTLSNITHLPHSDRFHLRNGVFSSITYFPSVSEAAA